MMCLHGINAMFVNAYSNNNEIFNYMQLKSCITISSGCDFNSSTARRSFDGKSIYTYREFMLKKTQNRSQKEQEMFNE